MLRPLLGSLFLLKALELGIFLGLPAGLQINELDDGVWLNVCV